MLDTHITDRLTINEHVGEIALRFGRVESSEHAELCNIELQVENVTCGKSKHSMVLNPYSSKDGIAHFAIPDEFKTATFPVGVYKAKLMVNCCMVDEIELLKSRPYIASSHTNGIGCEDISWQEPVHCKPKKKKARIKKCGCASDDIITVPTLNLSEEL